MDVPEGRVDYYHVSTSTTDVHVSAAEHNWVASVTLHTTPKDVPARGFDLGLFIARTIYWVQQKDIKLYYVGWLSECN